MAKFQVGDTVRMKSSCSGSHKGEIYKVFALPHINCFGVNEENYKRTSNACTCESLWELVTKNNPMATTSLIEMAKLAFKGEPEKSFIKAGVLDSNENLTSDGQQLFLTYLLKKHGEDFKTTVIDPIIKAGEEK